MTPPARPAPDAGVLVVGVGGIGSPCAWALADAGVRRLVLVDPDRVEPSNLPRQVLFGPADVGRPKAEVAAARLARPGLRVEAVVGRFDAQSGPPLVASASVVVDATDGASTKDLVNALAVAGGKPLVHAAALGSEGRVLDVPAGGRPCLSCLFGLTADAGEGDTCARFGVYPGVAGAVGALAARAALGRMEAPAAPSRGLRVLDLGAPRAMTLEAVPDARCPACGAGPRASLPAGSPVRAVVALGPAPEGVLDLREESCPMNLLRARRAVERLAVGQGLEIWLGEEGAATVPDGLARQGHAVLDRAAAPGGLALRVARGAGGAAPPSPRADDDWLRRFARQIVMPEVGEDGQRRWNRATVRLRGGGDALLSCAVHLAAAGIGTLLLDDPAPVGPVAARWPFRDGSARQARDEALADALRRHGGSSVRVDRGPEAPAPGVLEVDARDGGPAWRRAVAAAGPCARAEGALVADATMRRLVGLPARPDLVRVDADGAVASA